MRTGDRLSQGREPAGGARRAPARAVSWILLYRQPKLTRQGEYPHAELHGASNRPTGSSLCLSEATSQTAAKIPFGSYDTWCSDASLKRWLEETVRLEGLTEVSKKQCHD